MTIHEIYDRFFHMEAIILDPFWSSESKNLILKDLWLAVKEELHPYGDVPKGKILK